jgi:hypothetical protein
MNAAFRTLAGLLVLAAAAMADPRPPGRVVVLDNENLIEGQVTRTTDGYQIWRAEEGAITVPAKRVLAVVADRREAFAVVAERANRRDADERLRLARWCAVNGLNAEALAEARTAARMRPRFDAAERYVRLLEAVAKAVPPVADPAVVPARAEGPARDTVTDVPATEYNSESFPLFAGRVNTILVNTCANCHARDDTKAFRLTRAGGRAGITKNLMAALPHLNPADPGASPLLVKALTPHGGAADAPFRSRAHPAYPALESWVRFARAPEGTQAPDGPLLPPDPAEPRKLPDLSGGPPGPVVPAAGKTPATPPPGETFGQDSTTPVPRPTKAVPDDPFDPAIFNGEVKPRK